MATSSGLVYDLVGGVFDLLTDEGIFEVLATGWRHESWR
jgi:hypothetical protein